MIFDIGNVLIEWNPERFYDARIGADRRSAFMDQVPERVIVVFDEAYYEFLEEPLDTLKYVKEGRNVVVMRTFSKIQGLASLRIGYGIAPKHLADILQKTRQPFNANAIAQAGALAGAVEASQHDARLTADQAGRIATGRGRRHARRSRG